MLVLTLLLMKRGTYDTVTLPVLIPCVFYKQEGVATFLPVKKGGIPKPVRAFTHADLDRKSKESSLRTMTDPEWGVFNAIWRLMQGLKDKDKFAISQAHAKLLGGTSEREQTVEEMFARAFTDKEPEGMLSLQLSQALDSVRLVLWQSGHGLQPALYCPDPKSALYTFVLTSLFADKKRLSLCPFCGEFLVPRRPDQTYCSIAHREAHRVARWRAAKRAAKGSKAKKKTKRRKNVTDKTR
jgi:hypothetical protein